MSRTIRRRISLLAGSSLIAAALTLAGAVVLAPAAAFAANECGDPNANGATGDILTCATPPTYATGLDYSTTSNGNLTVILQNRFDTGAAGTGGIRMFGKTGETMTLMREDNSTGAGDPRIVNTAGRAIDVTSAGAGNVVVNLTDGDPIPPTESPESSTNVTTGAAPIRITGSTDAIRAEALGTGTVNVTFTPTGTPSGVNHPQAVITAGAAVGSNGSGIVARSTSGAINIETRGAIFTINGTNGGSAIDAVSTSGNVTITAGPAAGRLRGILAQTGGAGIVSVTATSGASASGTGALAGIDTVAGTGATTITLTGGTVSGGTSGAAIRSVSASTSATAAVSVQNTGGTVNGRVDFSGLTAGAVTFNNTAGSWSASGASIFSGFNDTVTFSGTSAFVAAANATIDLGAGNDVMTASGGQFNLGANASLNLGAGADTLTTSGTGQVTLGAGSTINFGAGNDTYTLSAPRAVASGATLAFGDGVDTMNLSSTLVMNGLTVSGVEALNFSGVILMGGGVIGTGNNPALDFVTSDGVTDDVLVMTGGTFTGAGGRVAMDVRLDPDSLQAGCATLTGDADCLDLRGASTAGQTRLTLNYIGDGATLGSYNPVGITLVDVAGAGTSAAGHFVIDPNTPGYVDDPMFGGSVSRPGLFVYALRYDPVNQRHALVGLPRGEVMEYAMLGGAAQSIWHMTAETVTDRQTDLRDGAEGGSVWMRASGEYTKRNVATEFENFGDTFTFDNSYKLYAGTITGGMDFAAGSAGGYDYVFGGQIGYVGSSFDLNASGSSGRFSGATGGVYASLWSPQFFVDGTLNTNVLTLDYDAAGLGLKTNTYLNSVGGKVEGGARFMLGEATFAEPLATVAYVRTRFEEISLSGGEVKPADATSLRGAIGLRLGANLSGPALNASYFVAGRAWEEFEGDNRGGLNNAGADLAFGDDVSGGFGEAELGVNLFNTANTVSGFLTSGVKFKDGYSAIDLAAGVRLAW